MPGAYTNAYPVKTVVSAYSAAAVAAAATLVRWVCPMNAARIGAVVANAPTAGTGGASTVVDVLKNGVSVWTAGADRPTLLAASTGEFNNTQPNVRSLQKGDVLTITVPTISTTGHAGLSVSVAIEGV